MNKQVYERYVIKIAECGSFTRAAEALGISQPAISAGITGLERVLGFRIFDRKNSPIAFTPEGRIYLEHLQKLNALTKDLNDRIDAYRKSINSTVTVGGPVAYVNAMLTDAVLWLQQQDPQCSIHIKCAPVEELTDMAAKGKLNCFVSTVAELPDNFEKLLIHLEQLYLCIPREDPINGQWQTYAVRSGEQGELPDYSLLQGRTFICLEQNQPLQRQTEQFWQTYGIAPEQRITVNQVSTALNLALKGAGVCVASQSALEGKLDLSSVCLYSLPPSISGRSIYLAYNRDLYMPDAGQLLLRYFTEVL